MKLITVALLFLLTIPGFAAPKPVNFELIEIPNGSITPKGINNLGDVSGWAQPGISGQPTTQGFIRTGDQITFLNAPGADLTFTWGIDDQRRVIGFAYFEFDQRPFLYENGQYTFLLPGFFATGISEGRIVGIAQDGKSFLYADGQYTPIDYPGASSTIVYGISRDRIVGRFEDGEGRHGFLLENGQYQKIDFPIIGAVTEVYDVSANAILGAFQSSSCGFDPFLLTHDKRFQQLGPGSTTLEGINDAGYVTGSFGASGFIAKVSNFISKGGSDPSPRLNQRKN